MKVFIRRILVCETSQLMNPENWSITWDSIDQGHIPSQEGIVVLRKKEISEFTKKLIQSSVESYQNT